MKTTLNLSYIIFFLLLFICNSSSQWVEQYNPSTINLQDVTFINRYTGWACGDGSQIVKTTNGGVNWVLQNSGVTSKILTGIHAVDSQVVYCVGWWQTILKTTNGGTNWIIIRNGPIPPPQVGSFYGIYFLNRTTGWLLRNEYVLRTTDGGVTFDSTHINFSYLRDIYFKDAQTGIMCTDASGIFRSTNGGILWNQIPIPQTTTESPDFHKESFVGNTGWVVGAGSNVQGLGPLTWRTTNFGVSWDTLGRVPYPYTHQNYCVYFTSLNTGWCGGSYGHIFKTTNGGFNWYEQIIPSNYFRSSMWFYNDTTGWVVGGAGQILFTTNGGTYVNVENIMQEVPSKFNLYQNYPNPFNPHTDIDYNIKYTGYVNLIVYDALGREIIKLVNETQKVGSYKADFSGNSLSSGIYFYSLFVNGKLIDTKKMILIK